MSLFKVERKPSIWGLAGFILGAALTGAAIGALGHTASTSPQLLASQQRVQNAVVIPILPQRIIVSRVKNDEIEAAINDFPLGVQRKIRTDVATEKYRLL